MTPIKASWSAFSARIARVYLDGWGHPSSHSKALTATLLAEIFEGRSFRLADFGCGNGHLCDYFATSGLSLDYVGYDFSTSLLEAARQRYAGRPRTRFVEADIEDPALDAEPSDIVLFSHVIEMLQSPQKALLAARRVAPLIMIRFFEPPIAKFDITEMRQLDVGGDRTEPYLRRTMSKAYYNLLLNEIGCRSVAVHYVDGDKDQVHVLRFE